MSALEMTPEDRPYVSWVGGVLFGVASLALFMIVQFWSTLGVSLSPAVLAIVALVLIAIHVVLLRPFVVGVDPLVWIPPAMLFFYFGIPLSIDLIPGTTSLAYDAWGIGLARNLDRGFGMALLTMVAFIWGLHLHPIQNLKSMRAAPPPTTDSLAVAGLVLALGGLMMIFVGILIVGPSVAFASYGDVFASRRAGLDFRFFDLGPTFARCGVLAMLASHRKERRLMTTMGMGLAALIMIFLTVIGDRGGLVSFGLAVGWIYTLRIRSLRPAVILAAAFLVFLALPAIKEFRVYGDLQDTQESSVSMLVRQQVYEMGTSSLVFGHTLDWIPRTKSYDYGLSFVRSIAHLVPNLGFTAGKNFLPDPLQHSPSHWLTNTINPNKYDAGGGYGYAIGAEWYFNFGVIGVLFGMTLIGYVVGYARSRALEGEMRLLLSALFFTMIVVSIRNILGAPLKAVVWPLIGIVILRAIAKQLLGEPRRNAPPAEPTPQAFDATR